MIVKMIKGVVTWFNGQDNKKFGFILIGSDEPMLNGKTAFFHLNDYDYFIDDGHNEPVWAYDGMIRRYPKKGDRLVFDVIWKVKGPTASPWGFADDYERIKKEITAQSSPQIYRVLKHKNAGEKPTGEHKLLWQGQDIADLCERYPRTSNSLMDRLHPAFKLNLCDIIPIIWFERLDKEGWVECDDPRPVEHGWRGDPYPLNTVIE